MKEILLRIQIMITKKNGQDDVVALRNKINGEIFYTIKNSDTRFIDGVEYLKVFSAPPTPAVRFNWMRKDSLDRA